MVNFGDRIDFNFKHNILLNLIIDIYIPLNSKKTSYLIHFPLIYDFCQSFF